MPDKPRPAANYDKASIEIWYEPKAAPDAETKAKPFRLTFNLKNGFYEKFQELESEMAALDFESWLRGKAYYDDQPINQLPED